MFDVIADVLTEVEFAALWAEIETLSFAPGELTAGAAAKRVKRNLQATDFGKTDAHRLIMRKLARHAGFQAAALPSRISGLQLSKYEAGMGYGLHIDNPLMEAGHLRSDLAFTIFIASPESYSGGELEIQLGSGPESLLRYKLPAGSMVVYPAHYLHQVRDVVSGTRVAVVGWVQSRVRDNGQRDAIKELRLVSSTMQDGEASAALNRVLSNLLRMWTE